MMGTVRDLFAYLHKEESGDMLTRILWTSYGEAIADKYSML